MTSLSRTRLAMLASIALGVALPAHPSDARPTDDHRPASRATFEVDARLRHEHVADDAFGPTADATTLRVRAGLRLALSSRWDALLEGEGVAAAGDHYNSGANGQTAYPAVIDPQAAELNQAWLRWQSGAASATVGRQRLLIDNQRWIGNVGWRQNEQTFDALATQWEPVPGLTLRYAWLERVHRVFSDAARDPLARERRLDSHLLNLGWKHGGQQLAGYAYLHDDRDVPAASTATLGLRWTRRPPEDGWGWTVEAARQRDHGDNPLSFSHRYWLLEPSLKSGGVTWRGGWEHLGGDGRHALQTPLATLHAFDGWADVFLVTPANGLEDRYLGVDGAFEPARARGKWNWAVTWHDFAADHGGGRYGHELDASLGFPVRGPVHGLVKLADYRSDAGVRDIRKIWLQLEWKR